MNTTESNFANVKHFAARVMGMILGLILYAIGIVLTMKANIGYAPWEVFHAGLSAVTGVGIGLVSIFTGVIIVAIVTLLGEKLGLGTLVSMIVTGVFVDILIWINIIPVAEQLLPGVLMLIVGLFVISVGSYFYMKSALGVGPRDNLMVVLTRKTKIPVGICRSAVELTATLIGWLLGGLVGIGTIISMFAVGLCVQITFRIFRFDVRAVKHETLRATYTALKKK